MFAKTIRRLTIAATAAIAVSGCDDRSDPVPQKPVTTSAEMSVAAQTDIEALISPWIATDAPGVSVAVALDGDIIFAQGAGMAELEQAQAIEPDTVFLVASVSKQFTAFATLLLVDEGLIDLDASIRTYIPEFGNYAEPITVRHLLDHMGGLRERGTLKIMAGRMADDIQTRTSELNLTLRQKGANFEAGQRVEYSNTGYALLAEIVARVSGQSFSEFTKTRIFDPLGMTRTQFPLTRNDLIVGRAAAYYPSSDGYKEVVAENETGGSSGLYTTAPDLLLWAENFQKQTVGSEAVFAMMNARASAANGKDSVFAKGQEFRPYKGLETWAHGGRDAGYRSFLLRIPGEGFAVSILSNRTDFDTAKLAFSIVDQILGERPAFKPETVASWSPSTAEELGAFEGHYELYPSNIYTITENEGGLYFGTYGAAFETYTEMPQIGSRRFLLNPQSDISIEFPAPENGRVSHLDYVIGLHGKLPGKRIYLQPFDPDRVDLTDYAGTFYSEELATIYALRVEGAELIASLDRHCCYSDFTLTPYQADLFAGLGGPLEHVQFLRNDRGDITGFTAASKLAEGLAFTRIDIEN